MFKIRNILITYISKDGTMVQQIFVDWFDVSDWLKQKEKAGAYVTICGWKYVDHHF